MEQQGTNPSEDKNKMAGLIDDNNIEELENFLNTNEISELAGKTYISYACKKSRFEIVKLLISKGVSANKYTDSEFVTISFACKAIGSGDYRIVEEVCKGGAKLTDVGYLGE